MGGGGPNGAGGGSEGGIEGGHEGGGGAVAQSPHSVGYAAETYCRAWGSEKSRFFMSHLMRLLHDAGGLPGWPVPQI